jgi:ubiquinone/menaquinone biosynthesis C-methylase UbiE
MKKNDKIWDNLYHNDNYLNTIPYTEIFAFLMKYLKGQTSGKKLLEIGCGNGNNLAFAKWAYDFEVYGIDQSATAIEKGLKYFENLGVNFDSLEVGNVEHIEFPDQHFDVVIDRAAIQHNTLEKINVIIKEVYRVLRGGGAILSKFDLRQSSLV